MLANELPAGKVEYAEDEQRRSINGPSYQIEEHLHADGSLARRLYQPADLELRLPLDRHGRAAGIELNGLKASYAYDARGQIERIDLPGNTSINISRDAAGRPLKFAFGDGLAMDLAYDRADRITAVEAKQAAAGLVFQEGYAYDAAGNLAELKAGSASGQRFEYDQDQRLTKVASTRGEQRISYDVDGNLLMSGSQRWLLDASGRLLAQGATRYAWDASGNLKRMQSADAVSEYSFDAADRFVRRQAIADAAADQAANAEQALRAATSQAEREAAERSLAEAGEVLQRMNERGRLRYQANFTRMAVEQLRNASVRQAAEIGPDLLRASEETLERATRNLESHIAGGAYRSAWLEGERTARAAGAGAAAVGKTPTLDVGERVLRPNITTNMAAEAAQAGTQTATDAARGGGAAAQEVAESIGSRLWRGLRGLLGAGLRAIGKQATLRSSPNLTMRPIR